MTEPSVRQSLNAAVRYLWLTLKVSSRDLSFLASKLKQRWNANASGQMEPGTSV